MLTKLDPFRKAPLNLKPLTILRKKKYTESPLLLRYNTKDKATSSQYSTALSTAFLNHLYPIVTAYNKNSKQKCLQQAEESPQLD